jgi:transposase
LFSLNDLSKLSSHKLLTPVVWNQDVAAELGVSFASLSKWRNEFKSKGDLKANKESLEAKQENDKLKSEIKRLKMENEILKQAAQCFASQK